MKLSHFTNKVIEDGIKAAFSGLKDDTRARDAAIAGLEACRGLDRLQLANLLVAATTAAIHGKRTRNLRLAELITFRAEVVWVCELVSVVLANQGLDPIIEYSPQAFLKAAEVIGSDNHLQ